MKKYFDLKFVFFLFCGVWLMAQDALAQFYISTYERTDAYWENAKEEWKVTNQDDNATLFEFNEEMTMFKHTTNSISSTYYIKESYYDEPNERYELSILSDVGNKYTMIIDLANENLRFIYEKNGTSYLVQHSIKKAWTN